MVRFCSKLKLIYEKYFRHHPYHLFEDITGVEGFAKKYDSSLFLFGTNQKKRPDTLVFGRMYDHQLLDMFELRVTNYVPASHFKVDLAF